ncbi:MAG: succinyl-diaminopimelate desuccinylase [Actinobacteria bacterium]|nr:succinyl-diaminopimelate desuccinylase [Actinomycetota bacterium]
MAADAPAAERLARTTLALVDIPSESRREQAIADFVAEAMPRPPTWREGETLWYAPDRLGRPFVVLAGHLDTVPAQANSPGRVADGSVHGLGASDMKGGLAVMVELAREIAGAPVPGDLGIGFLFFPREEVAMAESPLPAFFATGAIAEAGLIVVLEPTDNEIHAGCLGNVVARLEFEGESAHSARPWTGVNAIAIAVEALAPITRLDPVDVESGGLVFREVVSVTGIKGGVAHNVVPARAAATLNYRFAPGRSEHEAQARLRELVGDAGTLVVETSAPAAPVPASNPLLDRLRRAGDLPLFPKQAWTPVAQFAERGLDAVNFGPGAPAYAHRTDERVEIAALVRSYETLRSFAGVSV